jgi:large subunit ribosomal protein L6
MSRIGKLPIEIVSGVKVSIDAKDANLVHVEGPKGKLSYETRPEIDVKIEDNNVVCTIARPSKESSAYWGLTRSLIANMIAGVTKGFEKKMELIGVGYRVKQVSNDTVSLTVGYSHPVEYKAPQGVEIKVEDQTHFTVSGIDKHLVGLAAAKLRKIRKPEPYKGKGIKYLTETIRRKAGKTGKTGK